MFDLFAAAVPRLNLSADYSRIEMRPYTWGIRALAQQRPTLFVGEIELYLQVWFQAVEALRGNEDKEHQLVDRQCS
jgi:hypothetical protein